MHNLAIALHLKGDTVSGSDDEIFHPSKGRLEKYNLLPSVIGWDPDKVTKELDAVILGMHARADNPELKKAQALGLPIYSYPEYIYEQTKHKTRLVVGGSHGKTSITAMILHVLQYHGVDTDYMVGAQLAGFECMVRLSETAKIAVLEGDEYLSSPIDRRPKFHLYQPDVALISGIAWDHINVFPTFEDYVMQFDIFARCISTKGVLIYCENDQEVAGVSKRIREDIVPMPYTTHKHEIENGITYLITEKSKVPLEIFGGHNLQNLNGARLMCNQAGISDEQFYEAIQTFKGASKRLELVKRTTTSVMYKDFAHSPSKLKATTTALKEQFPQRRLIACMELHTFSSLNKDFLGEYDGAMKTADRALVFFDPKVVAHKRLDEVSAEEVKAAFGTDNVEVYTNADELINELRKETWEQTNLLMMSSGNFHGVDFAELGAALF